MACLRSSPVTPSNWDQLKSPMHRHRIDQEATQATQAEFLLKTDLPKPALFTISLLACIQRSRVSNISRQGKREMSNVWFAT